MSERFLLCLDLEDISHHGDKGPAKMSLSSSKSIRNFYMPINVPFSLLKFGLAVQNDDET
jgi:hypothetical protein